MCPMGRRKVSPFYSFSICYTWLPSLLWQRKGAWSKEGSPTALTCLGSKMIYITSVYSSLSRNFHTDLPHTTALAKTGELICWGADKMYWVHAQPYAPILWRLGLFLDPYAQGDFISDIDTYMDT